MQGHWINRGYRTVDDWLASFSSKKRHMIRRERAAPAEQGITIRTVRGPEIAADPTGWGRLIGELYGQTVAKIMWGPGFLNAKFFARLFERMPEPLEVVVAEKEGRPIAGAFNMSGGNRLWGRYWGTFEDHPFLHFNVCLYHSVEDSIQRGLATFEGGAGGEHKLHRGFEPSPTHSAHKFLHPALDRAIRDYLQQARHERTED
jgi:predicted N-acyltransferase